MIRTGMAAVAALARSGTRPGDPIPPGAGSRSPMRSLLEFDSVTTVGQR